MTARPAPGRFLVAAIAIASAAAAMLVALSPRSCPRAKAPGTVQEVTAVIDADTLMVDPVVRVLFLHHSTGGRWLASKGTHAAHDGLLWSSPHGGGLRDRLEVAGFEVHQATYGSRLGEHTDVFDWPGKFRAHMDEILRCDRQDVFYEDERRNHVVVFKSCFPNNLFVGAGREPGDPAGPVLDVANARAAYRALLPEFARHPETLFVAVSAPPLACPPQPRWKVWAKRLLGRPDLAASGAHARTFDRWLADPDHGWLADYAGTNVAVFDLYDLLTGEGASDFNEFPTGEHGEDSHPSAAGLERASARFVPFLARAVRGNS